MCEIHNEFSLSSFNSNPKKHSLSSPTFITLRSFYRDGYYKLPYICNSPQIMLDSFKGMPYTKFNEANNYIETHNPFTDGKMYFRELSEGLWITISEIEFKKNVSTHAL